MNNVISKIVKIVNFCAFVMLFFTFIAKFSYADSKRMRCNLNSECRPGFVCVGGIGANVDTAEQSGCCEIILPLRQVCLFHNLIAGKFGRGIVALVVISMGLAGIFGKLGWKSLLTFSAHLRPLKAFPLESTHSGCPSRHSVKARPKFSAGTACSHSNLCALFSWLGVWNPSGKVMLFSKSKVPLQ